MESSGGATTIRLSNLVARRIALCLYIRAAFERSGKFRANCSNRSHCGLSINFHAQAGQPPRTSRAGPARKQSRAEQERTMQPVPAHFPARLTIAECGTGNGDRILYDRLLLSRPLLYFAGNNFSQTVVTAKQAIVCSGIVRSTRLTLSPEIQPGPPGCNTANQRAC